MRLGCRHILTFLLCAGVLAAPGCKKAPPAPSGQQKDNGIARTAVRGPVTLTVRSDRSKATIAEKFTLTISAVAEDGVDVTMPQFADSLGAFAVRDFRQDEARPIEGQRRKWEQTYQIDCDLSGKYTIDSVTVTFNDRRKQPGHRPTSTMATTTQAAIVSQVSTEPFELEVTSLLEGQYDPNRFYDVKGPVTLPQGATRWSWWVFGGIVLAAALAAAAVLLIRRRRRKGPFTVQIPPDQWAMEELQRLIDDDLVGRGDIQGFYYRLNAIVRQYIEFRFMLMAPEMTTEEFLETLRQSDRLGTDHKALLEGFLTACDPVKYARYLPEKTEIEQVFNAARDLIVQTTRGSRAATAPLDHGNPLPKESAA